MVRKLPILVGLLTAVCWITFCRAVESQAAGAAPHPSRLNVLFVICDDLNDSVEGMGGHAQAKTPNIDRLMQRGVRFTNAQCNAVLCAPSRASLWSGLYPSTTGYYQVRDHWRHNPTLKDAVTIMEHFGANGYDVYGTGKVFHGYGTGKFVDGRQRDNRVWRRDDEFDGRGIGPSFGPMPWDGGPLRMQGASGRQRRIGACRHPMLPWALRRYYDGFGPLSDVPKVAADAQAGIPGYVGWRLGGKPFRYVNDDDRDLMPDERSARWVIERLKERRDRPFFIALGFNRPHVPLYAPKEYFDMFPLDTIRLPPYLDGDLEDCAEVLWKEPETGGVKRAWGFDKFRRVIDSGGVALWRRWIQAYLACTAFVDDQFGKVLDALDQSGCADNTIIIFTSDHGYHMGEKDVLFKNTVWEEAARVPLVVVAPGVSRAGLGCNRPVSLVDMYPTLIDLCGLPTHPNGDGNDVPLDGHGIRPLLEDPTGGVWSGPEVALTTLQGDGKWGTSEPGQVEQQHFAVRSDRYRYIHCSNGEEELYDLLVDPHGHRNIAAGPKHAEIKARLRRQLIRLAGLPDTK